MPARHVEVTDVAGEAHGLWTQFIESGDGLTRNMTIFFQQLSNTTLDALKSRLGDNCSFEWSLIFERSPVSIALPNERARLCVLLSVVIVLAREIVVRVLTRRLVRKSGVYVRLNGA
jgi:hypothetical protein